LTSKEEESLMNIPPPTLVVFNIPVEVGDDKVVDAFKPFGDIKVMGGEGWNRLLERKEKNSNGLALPTHPSLPSTRHF
jgi:hypothetical protein